MRLHQKVKYQNKEYEVIEFINKNQMLIAHDGYALLVYISDVRTYDGTNQTSNQHDSNR